MKKRNYINYIIAIVIVGALAVLIVVPRLNDPNREDKKRWKAADVRCLTGGHVNLAQHIHSRLVILVDGEQELIGANIGVVQGCMSETHTHDQSGGLHVESIQANKEFRVAQFFTVWGKSLEREGYTLSATIGGVETSGVENIIFRDGQQIVLEYRSDEYVPPETSEIPTDEEEAMTEEDEDLE